MNDYFYSSGNASNYQYHLLLATHPATKHLTASSKFKKLPTLEEKLRFILDDFEASRPNGETDGIIVLYAFNIDM